VGGAGQGCDPPPLGVETPAGLSNVICRFPRLDLRPSESLRSLNGFPSTRRGPSVQHSFWSSPSGPDYDGRFAVEFDERVHEFKHFSKLRPDAARYAWPLLVQIE
jgi:hypothetical protein